MAISRWKAALLAAALCATARIARADCPEDTPQAACTIHEEGVASPIDAPAPPQTTPQPFRCATLAIGMGRFTGFELMTLAGLRTMTRIVHARIEAGVTRSTMETLTHSGEPSIPLRTVSWIDIYPVIGIGGGLHVGRVRLHASVLYAANFCRRAQLLGSHAAEAAPLHGRARRRRSRRRTRQSSTRWSRRRRRRAP